MSLGMLIKFHREKKELTQEELGRGICSVTHISKIERGITQYSSEITSMISDKLGIHLENEMESLQEFERMLDQWHDSMIMQQNSEMDRLKTEIEKHSLFLIHSIKNKYTLLHARYLLHQGDLARANKLLAKMNMERKELNTYECNLLHHLLGMAKILNGNFKEALEYLLKINERDYHNQEFYHQIAISYLNLQLKVKAYYYSELALEHFRKTSNYKKVIDAETIKLISEGRNELWDFEELVARYHRLIAQCDMINEKTKKAALLSNLAYEYAFRGENTKAADFYKRTLELLEATPRSPVYLNNLIGYIYCSLQNDIHETDLAELIEKGKHLSKMIEDQSSFMFFQMLNLLEKKEMKAYHEFIEKNIIPMLEKSGKIHQLRTYEKTMYEHYMEVGNHVKALEYANRLIKD
ncbi:helix-turn-helix transcriptional regulator [Bacillus sp. RO1]|uniref:helix-turn-helix domain-containing protein n=1 Tax=Bacillus sp. RO1 TaxID=2722703 RepID=UPI0014567FBC|nr:helix-turn-helix transcriptional regulator [Bacillus sp. RO1]